jgi:hypothetical protein
MREGCQALRSRRFAGTLSSGMTDSITNFSYKSFKSRANHSAGFAGWSAVNSWRGAMLDESSLEEQFAFLKERET